MNTTDAPKPGPLHAQTARAHALEADRLLNSIEPESPAWKLEHLAQLAQAHALTSLALTQLNPPPRQGSADRVIGKGATS